MSFTPIIGAEEILESTNLCYGVSAVSLPSDGGVLCAYGFVDYGAGYATDGWCKIATVDPVTFETSLSSRFLFTDQTARYPRCAFDDSSKAVAIIYSEYTGGNNPFKLVCGSVSGGTASFGTPSAAISTYGTMDSDISFDSSHNKFAAVFVDNGVGKGIIFGASSGVLSLGSTTTFCASGGVSAGIEYNLDGGNFAVTYTRSSNLYGKVGTYDGSSSITYSTEVLLATSCSDSANVVFDEQSGLFIVVSRSGSGFKVASFAIVSGEIVKVDDEYTATQPTATSEPFGLAYDLNCKKAMLTVPTEFSLLGYAVLATSDSISLSSPVTIMASGVNRASLAYDYDSEKVVSLTHNVDTTIGAMAVQIYESAPKNFWTNFSGQSEIL